MKLICSSLIFFVYFAQAAYRKDFTKQLYVVGVGQIKMEYKFTGEPVSRPRMLSFWVKCEGSKEWKPVGAYMMCELDRYRLDGKSKEIHIQFLDGRVNEGVSYCDVKGDERLPMTKLCTDQK